MTCGTRRILMTCGMCVHSTVYLCNLYLAAIVYLDDGSLVKTVEDIEVPG